MSVDYVNFKFDGEWITQTARNWLWNERKPFSVVENLLTHCLVCDSVSDSKRKEIIVGILEGRYKLCGINTFTLEEDNKDVRPLSEYIRLQEKDIMISRILEDMDRHPLLYVDEYSSIKSYAALCKLSPNATYNEVYEWYVDRLEEENPLWIFENANLVFDLIGDVVTDYNRELFFDKLADYLGDKYPERQRRYKMSKKIKSQKQERDYNDAKYAFDKKDINYLVDPDLYVKDTGWISPYGEYYSCDFGGHTVKSEFIVQNNNILKNKFLKWKELRRSDGKIMSKKFPTWEIPLSDLHAEFLLESGWIKFHNPHIGDSFPEYYVRPTKEQMQALFDVCTHFEYSHNYGLDDLD